MVQGGFKALQHAKSFDDVTFKITDSLSHVAKSTSTTEKLLGVVQLVRGVASLAVAVEAGAAGSHLLFGSSKENLFPLINETALTIFGANTILELSALVKSKEIAKSPKNEVPNNKRAMNRIFNKEFSRIISNYSDTCRVEKIYRVFRDQLISSAIFSLYYGAMVPAVLLNGVSKGVVVSSVTAMFGKFLRNRYFKWYLGSLGQPTNSSTRRLDFRQNIGPLQTRDLESGESTPHSSSPLFKTRPGSAKISRTSSVNSVGSVGFDFKGAYTPSPKRQLPAELISARTQSPEGSSQDSSPSICGPKKGLSGKRPRISLVLGERGGNPQSSSPLYITTKRPGSALPFGMGSIGPVESPSLHSIRMGRGERAQTPPIRSHSGTSTPIHSSPSSSSPSSSPSLAEVQKAYEELDSE